MERLEREKQLAAIAAAEMVEDGMKVGLGTGTTVAHLLPALAERKLEIHCVSTSPRTEEAATKLGIDVGPFDLDQLDIAIDGADQIDPQGWLVKGGGGAHTREKIVAITARRFIVIADSSKPVGALRAPVPLELLGFGLESTLERIGTVKVRGIPPSPDGGVIADYTGEVGDPAKLSEYLSGIPGVVDHGLFPPTMVSVVLVGHVEDDGESVETIGISHR